MPRFSISRNVPYSVEQVFEIAANVGAYREFLPLVKRTVVSDKVEHADGTVRFRADMVIAYRKLGISDTLRSDVIVDPATHTVSATAHEGPVTSLVSEWKIVPGVKGGAEIRFTVDYTLKSRSLQFLLSGMFDMVVRKIMTAFELRARKLYGPPAIT